MNHNIYIRKRKALTVEGKEETPSKQKRQRRKELPK
jgi:hypothetical protein